MALGRQLGYILVRFKNLVECPSEEDLVGVHGVLDPRVVLVVGWDPAVVIGRRRGVELGAWTGGNREGGGRVEEGNISGGVGGQGTPGGWDWITTLNNRRLMVSGRVNGRKREGWKVMGERRR